MANPMHCDAQRNALGLSLQSIAFFPAPNCSEISIFVPMYRQEEKICDSQQGRELGNLVQNDERMADYTEFYFHICKFHGIYAVGVVLVVGSGVCGKHAF